MELDFENIKQCNQLIAEFMGETIRSDGRLSLNSPELLTGRCIVDAKYHFSYDWIMQVVEEIESIDNNRYDVHITQLDASVHIWSDRGQYAALPYVTSCRSNEMPKTRMIWQAVVKFIYWYNKNKTNAESITK